MKKHIFWLSLFLIYLPNAAFSQVLVAIDSISVGNTDGRFTLGAGNARLMYGYPVPHSTSHFVIATRDRAILSNYNEKGKLVSTKRSYSAASPKTHYGSNSTVFSQEEESEVAYLSGETQSKGNPLAPSLQTVFIFRQMKITQHLLPVNKEFEPTKPDELAQYYLVRYTLENLSDSVVKDLRFKLLFDTMIDDNDACIIHADSTRISTETYFQRNIPKEFFLYRKDGKKDDMMGTCITSQKKLKVSAPDDLFVGRWTVFHRVLWHFKPVEKGKIKYDDSAIMMRWTRTLQPKQTIVFSTLYGLPHWKKPELSLLTSEPKLNEAVVSVFFGLGEAELDAKAKKQITALFQDKDVKGVILDAHADAFGEDGVSWRTSKKRLEAVKNFVAWRKLPVTPKIHGNELADKNKKETGERQDRRVDVKILYR